MENSSSNWPNLAGARQDEDQSMKRSRFTEEQIIGILKKHEAGVSVADLCRKHGVSDAS
jgi:putative transposase